MDTRKALDPQAITLMLVLCAIWGMQQVVLKATAADIAPVMQIGLRSGVAALLVVLSITSGFERQFRDKVLGVNAHVLVLKYGLDFHEYREVIERCQEEPEVVGVGPFLINQMMLAKGDRLSTVMVKGVDPEAMVTVLDLPSQIIAGSLEGMRLPDAAPPLRPEDLRNPDLPYWRALMDPNGERAVPAPEGEPSEEESPSPAPEPETELGAPTPTPGRVASPSDVEALLVRVDAVGMSTRYINNESTLLLEDCVVDIGSVLLTLREEGYRRIVLVGNSGGGGLVAFGSVVASVSPMGVNMVLGPKVRDRKSVV